MTRDSHRGIKTESEVHQQQHRDERTDGGAGGKDLGPAIICVQPGDRSSAFPIGSGLSHLPLSLGFRLREAKRRAASRSEQKPGSTTLSSLLAACTPASLCIPIYLYLCLPTCCGVARDYSFSITEEGPEKAFDEF